MNQLYHPPRLTTPAAGLGAFPFFRQGIGAYRRQIIRDRVVLSLALLRWHPTIRIFPVKLY
jgi:hypothetical protein